MVNQGVGGWTSESPLFSFSHRDKSSALLFAKHYRVDLIYAGARTGSNWGALGVGAKVVCAVLRNALQMDGEHLFWFSYSGLSIGTSRSPSLLSRKFEDSHHSYFILLHCLSRLPRLRAIFFV